MGIGRNALHGLGAGGRAGVEKLLEILKAELETTMRQLGVVKVSQLGPHHVNCEMPALAEINHGKPGQCASTRTGCFR